MDSYRRRVAQFTMNEILEGKKPPGIELRRLNEILGKIGMTLVVGIETHDEDGSPTHKTRDYGSNGGIMPTIRERIADAVGGQPLREERGRVRQQMELLLDAQFQLRRDPEMLARELEEMDSHLLDMIMQQRGWSRVGGAMGAGGLQLTDSDRLAEVASARWMTYHDVQSKNAVQTWTDFGFGQSVSIVPRDSHAAEIWSEFWTARRNRPTLGERILHEQSNEAVISGELFFPLWTDSVSGMNPSQTTIRSIRTEEIRQIVTLPEDAAINVWYIQSVDGIKVNGVTYDAVAYRDWMATPEQLDEVPVPDGCISASELRPNTDAVMLYAARNRYLVDSKQYRGFPEFKQAYQWFREYTKTIGDIIAKARAVAMFVDKLKITGGSRALKSIASQLTSTLATGTNRMERNPVPVAGSTWLQNEQVDRTRMPLGTGASDDRQSTMIVLGQGSAGTKVPLGWSGRADAWQNRSVAEMTVLPWDEAMQRYQSWWSSVFRDMARVVLTQADIGLTSEEMLADVTLDTLLTVKVEELLAVVTEVVKATEIGIIGVDRAAAIVERIVGLALTKFGVVDVGEVMEPEATGAEAAVLENLKAGLITPAMVREWLSGELAEVTR